MSAGELALVHFGRLADPRREVAREARTAVDDPFDWSRRQVAAHHRQVYRVALGVLGPGGEAEAEEVAQEAFLRLHREAHRFEGRSRVATWLYRVAYRLAVDRIRRPRHRHPHVDDAALAERPAPAESGDPFERLERRQRAWRLERALRRLTPRQQAVIRLHYWLEEGVGEIAALLDLPTGTVKSDLHRGRQALARVLAEEAR